MGFAVLFKTHNLTLAHHRVSTSSVVSASDSITWGRGFKSHLGLGFFRVYSNSPRINVYYLAFYKSKLRFILISLLYFISGEEPYHGCTDIKPLLLLSLLLLL